ncbi:hypothetical protein DIPPA_17352 [Diplonema papillatum]|nr:hypothetical protein DIPPA_17352 [Diplonema papillatum]
MVRRVLITRSHQVHAGVPVLGSHAGYSSDEDDDDDGANTRTRRDRVTFSDTGSPRSGRHLSRDSRSTVDGRSDHSRGRADARQGTHARNDYSNDRPGHQSRDSSYDPGHPANRSWGGGSPAATGRRSESSLRDGSPPHRELPPRGSSSPAAGGRASRHGTASLRMSRSASKSGSPQPPSPMLQRLRGTREERVYGERCALEAAKTVDPPGSTVGLRNLSDQPDLNLSTATVLRFIHHSEHGVVAHVQPKGHPSPVVVMLKNLVTATDLAELKRRASGRQAASPDAAPSALKDTRPHTHSVRGMSPPDVHRSDRLNFRARTASPGTPSRGRSIDRFDDRSQASYPRRNSEDKVVQRALSRDSPPSRSGTSHERTTDDAGLAYKAPHNIINAILAEDTADGWVLENPADDIRRMIRALKRAAPDPESDEPRGAAQSRQIFGFVRTVGGYGADVQLLDGSTALHLASRNGWPDVVKELIAAGAKVDVQDNGMFYDAKNVFLLMWVL